MGNKSVDIVVIGRNEGDLLRKALESSMRIAEEYAKLGNPRPEIIYVDGQSTDGSLELAKSLGVKVCIVKQRPNPAAGRHTAFQYCKAEYVFFLDGDMEVYSDWLPRAVSFLESNNDIAGVAGYCDWEVYEGDRVVRIPNHSGIKKFGELVTTDVGGAFLYKRSVLQETGDFDPTMIRNGEFELYLRILAKGYKLAYLTIPMCVHRDKKGNMGLSFVKRTLLTKNVFIPGVVARKAPKTKSTYEILFKRYWLYLWHLISILIICCMLLTLNFQISIKLTILILTISQLFYTHWIYKNKSLVRTVVSLFTINIYIISFIIGYLLNWPNIGGFYKNKYDRS